jgi:hypothetical protein
MGKVENIIVQSLTFKTWLKTTLRQLTSFTRVYSNLHRTY